MGLRVMETRVYYDAISGDVVHVHRLAVGAGQEVDENLRKGLEAFDQWLRSQHEREIDFLNAGDSDLPAGPIRVDVNTRTIMNG
ncbi:hypothetical protein [Actinoplanes sp. NPDC051411]|uniref:hypothetical protein n=1 Tax=Actinoplanes sp. NPDC051411 TaxID=3155522 RepID=UPI003439960D